MQIALHLIRLLDRARELQTGATTEASWAKPPRAMGGAASQSAHVKRDMMESQMRVRLLVR